MIPHRGSQTFISTIGHLDARLDLKFLTQGDFKPQLGNRALMDLCIMSSKLAYENPKLIQNVVTTRWNMHFVHFYDCWNGNTNHCIINLSTVKILYFNFCYYAFSYLLASSFHRFPETDVHSSFHSM